MPEPLIDKPLSTWQLRQRVLRQLAAEATNGKVDRAILRSGEYRGYAEGNDPEKGG